MKHNNNNEQQHNEDIPLSRRENVRNLINS